MLIDGEDIAVISDQALREVRRKNQHGVSVLCSDAAYVGDRQYRIRPGTGGMSKAERHDRALDALKQVNLEQWANSYPDELSGGMRQRIGLARALANDRISC